MVSYYYEIRRIITFTKWRTLIFIFFITGRKYIAKLNTKAVIEMGSKRKANPVKKEPICFIGPILKNRTASVFNSKYA